MQTSFRAWAIITGEGRFIGRYWFRGPALPEHIEGCRTALFTTRQNARERMAQVRSMFPKAKVVRVTISVSAAGV